MKVGDKFLMRGNNGTIEIIDKYFNPIYGEVVYDTRINGTNTIINNILQQSIINLVKSGAAVQCNKIEPIKYIQRLKILS